MNKKIIGIALCVLMLTLIPTAAGLQSAPEEAEGADGLLKRTVVKGFIFNPKTEGRTTTFLALFIQYTTYGLMGETDSGVVVLRRVSFNGRFTGFMGKFYVQGSFRGTI